MGCCENSRNILGYQNKNSTSSSSLKNLNETNLSNGKIIDTNIYIDKVIKTLLRNKTPKLSISKSKKIKFLDRINEEESESKESSVNNQRMSHREKKLFNIKLEKPKNPNIKLENIKTLRKNRSHPKFKIKLNEEMFVKKLNEYKENSKLKVNKYSNYISQLSHLKESKSEHLFNKTIGDSSLKDSINKIYKENRNRNNKKEKINNIYIKKKEKGSLTQYYEEEINRNSLQHVPRSISKMVIKKSFFEKKYKNQEDFFNLK